MGSGYIDKAELQAVLQKLGGDMSEEEVAKCYAELDGNDDGRIDFEEFSLWYLKSENRIETDVQALFNKFDHDNNGHIDIDELENLVAARDRRTRKTHGRGGGEGAQDFGLERRRPNQQSRVYGVVQIVQVFRAAEATTRYHRREGIRSRGGGHFARLP